MSNLPNISNIGIQINFPTWERWNLSALEPDGVILFQYLVFHCRNNAEWQHSDREIADELGIKRSRLKAIRTYLTESGILSTRQTRTYDNNKKTAYRINFRALTNRVAIEKVYRPQPVGNKQDDWPTWEQYAKTYKAIADQQPALGAKPATSKLTVEGVNAKDFAAKLSALYTSRQNKFNEGRKGKRVSVGDIKFIGNDIGRLASAIKHFGSSDYVYNAFMTFVDELLAFKMEGKSDTIYVDQIKSPIGYFLTFNESEGTYTVIRAHADHYTARYSRTQ